MDIETILKLENISKKYTNNQENKMIFENLNLDILQGDKISIVGSNGSGKSTLIKILVKQTNVDSGNIISLLNKEKIAYLPQDYRNSLFPWLNIRSNFSLLLNEDTDSLLLTDSTENQILNLFDTLKLKISLDKYPYQLSGGEQQAILLIQAVLKNPKLLIADEPFSAIDYHKKELFEDFFSNWIEEKKVTTIMVLHDMDEAVYLANRIIILTKESTNIKDDFRINLTQKAKCQSMKYDVNFRDIILHIKNNFE